MTTPQLAGFTGLNAYDKVVATSTTRRMQNKEWLARLKDGRVKKIGMEGNFDTEIIHCIPTRYHFRISQPPGRV